MGEAWKQLNRTLPNKLHIYKGSGDSDKYDKSTAETKCKHVTT